MTEGLFTRCARPTLTSRAISTYTILGFAGYAIASVIGGVLWARWEGRALWPVQLVESAASGILVIAGVIAAARSPGTGAIVYITGYGALRFALELVRGDAARPYLRGISEAQWLALASVTACAIWRPSAPTIIVATALAAALAAATAVLAARAESRELFQPPHLRELDDQCTRALADPAPARRETSLGVALSCHPMPDGRLDWVLSSSHPAWSAAAVRRLAFALWRDHEVVAGKTPGVMHILVPGDRPPEDDLRVN